jgi:hypothetical protein
MLLLPACFLDAGRVIKQGKSIKPIHHPPSKIQKPRSLLPSSRFPNHHRPHSSLSPSCLLTTMPPIPSHPPPSDPQNRITNIPYACANCSRTATSSGAALLRCSRCKSTWYCSPACKRTDWKMHKLPCAAIVCINGAYISFLPEIRLQVHLFPFLLPQHPQ